MWELDYKESWALKNWCFWIVVLEKTLESRLDCEEIQPVHPKGNQSWIFLWRTDVEAETPIICPPDANNWVTGKNPDAVKVWRHEEKRPNDRGWDGWMASPTQRTCVWKKSGSWRWTERPDVLQSMGWQRLGDHWVTEVNSEWLHIKQLSSNCTMGYITTFYPVWGQFLLPKNPGTNPVILKCILLNWVW